MSNPLVSVCMITYNHGPFVAEAIRGVLGQQTNFPFELIIGEDCSTDNTRNVVLEYRDRHPDIVKVITSEQNVGMNANAARVKAACKGKYLAFCEGDDYWHDPKKLQVQVEYLESHPECALVLADCDVLVNDSGRKIEGFNSRRGHGERLELRLDDDFFYGKGPKYFTCTAVVRRDLCQALIERDPYLHASATFLMGDVQLWAEIALLSQVVYMPESLATYRVVAESASNSRDKMKRLRFNRSCNEMILYLAGKHGLSERVIGRAEKDLSSTLLRMAYYGRKPDLLGDARKLRGKMSVRDYVFYCGAKSSAIYYVTRPFLYLLSRLVRNRDASDYI